MSLSQYRIYVQDEGKDRNPPLEVECKNDMDALSTAFDALRSSGTAEVWQGTRFLGKVKQP